MVHPAAPSLAGYRVAVTSARRSDELCTLLRRHGATVARAAAITMVALPDDDELHRNTEALIARPPDIVIATTGVGFRGWLAAADGWQLGGQADRGHVVRRSDRGAWSEGDRRITRCGPA